MKKEKGRTKRQIYDIILRERSLNIENNLKSLILKCLESYLIRQKYGACDKPTGKILVYSQFRGDAGLEAFELVLKSNGYVKYDPKDKVYDKRLRYTFITGQENDKERKINKDAYIHPDNKYGEYIQFILISESGAEGISVTCDKLWCAYLRTLLE